MKKKEFRNKNYDSFYFEYFLPGDNEPANRENQDALAKTSTDNQNIASEAERPITLLLTEALFKGQFETGKPKPFYFMEMKESDVLFWGEGKTLADMICESIEDITCFNPATRECDKEICEVEEAKIKARDNAVMTMESIIENLFESYEGQDILELPAWHFFFLKFNEYKWGGQSCDK